MTKEELNIIVSRLKDAKIAYSFQEKDTGVITFHFFGTYDNNGKFISMQHDEYFERYLTLEIKPNYDFVLKTYLYEDHYLDDDVKHPEIEVHQLDNGQTIWCECIWEEDEYIWENSNFNDVDDVIFDPVTPVCVLGARKYQQDMATYKMEE